MGRRKQVLPAELVRLVDQFSAWRKTRARGARIPNSLWHSAAECGRRFGVHRTSHAINVDYYALKKRVTPLDEADRSTNRMAVAAPRAIAQAAAIEFLELPGVQPQPQPQSEFTVELGDGSGATLRVHLKGHAVPNLSELCRNFWRGE